MLSVLERTVSMRRFFWAPKTYAKNMDKKIFAILRWNCCLSKPMPGTVGWSAVCDCGVFWSYALKFCYEFPLHLFPKKNNRISYVYVRILKQSDLQQGCIDVARYIFGLPLQKWESYLWNPRLVCISFHHCAVSVMNNQALSLSRYFPVKQNVFMWLGMR